MRIEIKVIKIGANNGPIILSTDLIDWLYRYALEGGFFIAPGTEIIATCTASDGTSVTENIRMPLPPYEEEGE